MRWLKLAIVFGLLVLISAAIWLGGLNQDEGWYLYAANLVAEGKLPYRDFAFTQGPLMPIVYSAFGWIWQTWGLLGARIFTGALGVFGIVIAMALARRMVPEDKRETAALITLALLGNNLYHLYYLSIPKTYALAGLMVIVGFYLIEMARTMRHWRIPLLVAGLALAFAAGTRVSLGVLLIVVGIGLLVKRDYRRLAWFCIGGFGGLAIVYVPFLLDRAALSGLITALNYHTARGGSDIVWTVGSFSRLVRWYLPMFVVIGLGGIRAAILPLAGFTAVFALQMIAPFPYEDYQVPVMGLLAVFGAVNFSIRAEGDANFRKVLLVVGLAWAASFGSPLLEQWMTNGQDRFWSLKKEKPELQQLREVADEIEALDPNGKELFTQDLYLAIETGRKVPKGLEMGPFAVLSDEEWKRLIGASECEIAALSGYSFAIEPPKCNERAVDKQIEYWGLLKKNYKLVSREERFGQNATTLLILKRK